MAQGRTKSTIWICSSDSVLDKGDQNLRDFSALGSSGDAKIEEILIQGFNRRPVGVVTVKDVAHLFSKSNQLLEPAGVLPPGITDRQIEQLQHAIKRIFETGGIPPLMGCSGAAKFTANVGELLFD